jgi:hypothetical protein
MILQCGDTEKRRARMHDLQKACVLRVRELERDKMAWDPSLPEMSYELEEQQDTGETARIRAENDPVSQTETNTTGGKDR